jgi:hypothetical protein
MGEVATKMRPLSAADIAGASDLKVEPMHIPEWGGTIYLRELADADAMEAFSRFGSAKSKTVSLREMCQYCAMGICDENGELIFEQEGGAQQLAKKKFAVISRVFNRLMELSGLTKAAIDAEKKG